MPLLFVLAVGKALIFPVRDALPELDEQHSDMARVCFDDGILLKPLLKPLLKSDSRYCFSPDSGVEAKVYRRVTSDDSADSEDSGNEGSSTSDENSGNRSNEDEADAKSDFEYVTTTLTPFPISNEISRYCATLVLKKIKQEAVSDSEILAESEVDVTEADSVNDLMTSSSYSTDHMDQLKTHKQNHLPAEQGPDEPKKPKKHQCDHEGCHYSTHLASHLKKHKENHLPVDQRPRLHHCDHKGCNFRTSQRGHLTRHIQTHLPADQRLRKPKVHQCGHEGCNYRTDHRGNLKVHKQYHLTDGQRPKVHQCDHEGCNFRTHYSGNLKKHKQTHLPADQRVKRSKRKTHDQPLSNEKRKKEDEE